MKRVIIVEDETAAVVNLRSMLAAVAGDVEVIAVLESVEETVEFFLSKPSADVVFMDIHLADGDSFRIFDRVDITIPIIFTTAYNEYALAKVTKKETRETLSSFEVKADECIECGKCESICPQSIDIRERLKKLAKL